MFTPEVLTSNPVFFKKKGQVSLIGSYLSIVTKRVHNLYVPPTPADPFDPSDLR